MEKIIVIGNIERFNNVLVFAPKGSTVVWDEYEELD